MCNCESRTPFIAIFNKTTWRPKASENLSSHSHTQIQLSFHLTSKIRHSNLNSSWAFSHTFSLTLNTYSYSLSLSTLVKLQTELLFWKFAPSKNKSKRRPANVESCTNGHPSFRHSTKTRDSEKFKPLPSPNRRTGPAIILSGQMSTRSSRVGEHSSPSPESYSRLGKQQPMQQHPRKDEWTNKWAGFSRPKNNSDFYVVTKTDVLNSFKKLWIFKLPIINKWEFSFLYIFLFVLHLSIYLFQD